MRGFPPIRDAYRGFDTFAQQFKTRERAEAYIREHNRGVRAGEVDPTQRDLLNYNFGTSRYLVTHHTTKSGRAYTVLGKQATATQTIRGKVYRPGWFLPLQKDEQNPEFKRLTVLQIEDDKRREREREEKLRRK